MPNSRLIEFDEFLDTPRGWTGAVEPPGYHTTGGHDEEGIPIHGPVASALPVDHATTAFATGAVAASPLDDIYNTIWVVPSEINVGRVTAAVTREVNVWNAYLVDRTLDSITITGDEGITLDGPALPHLFGPLADVVFTVEVGTDGPATIDASYTLVFSTAEGDPGWTVIGTRLLEWTLGPNWDEQVDETWQFKTEILTSDDGTEQRRASRHLPRREGRFSFNLVRDPGRSMNRLLSTWQNRGFAMADWPREVGTSGVPVGGNLITLQDSLPELKVGGLIVLREGGRSLAIEIEAIAGNEVTLKTPVAEAFGPLTLAYPGMLVHAPASVRSRWATSQSGVLELPFRQLHDTGNREAVPAAPDTWRDREVLMWRHNWAEPVNLEHNWPVDWLDSDRGVFDYRIDLDSPRDIRRYRYVMKTRDQVRDMINFFFRRMGRRNAFYLPTWQDDLRLPAGAILVNGSAALPATDQNDASRMENERVYRNICVRLTDGTVLYRQVIGNDHDGTNPTLVLDLGWPRNIERDEVIAIHWMPKSRLASDDMTISWRTNQVAEVDLAVIALEDVPV